MSAQERKILELIGEGLTNRQIGERMFLAAKTVKNYVSTLFAKLGMERRTAGTAGGCHRSAQPRRTASPGSPGCSPRPPTAPRTK